MDKKLAHLGMIQGVTNRLAANSFLLKSWSVTLVAALFALAAVQTQPQFIYLAYFPSLVFWILDGYFVHQERLYRKQYDRVRVLGENDIDFSMDTDNLKRFGNSWVASTFSVTLIIFHGVVVGSIVLVMIITLARD